MEIHKIQSSISYTADYSRISNRISNKLIFLNRQFIFFQVSTRESNPDAFLPAPGFCFLGEMLGEEGGAELAVANREGAGHGGSLSLWRLCIGEGRLYTACVRSCLLYGSETWALTKEYQRKLENTENRMIRKMYGLREGIPVEKMRQEMGVIAINDAIKLGTLRWFGLVFAMVITDR
jgi:hypothetical protein